jgi:hypothetical protein
MRKNERFSDAFKLQPFAVRFPLSDDIPVT